MQTLVSVALEQNKTIIPVKFPAYQKPKALTKKYADFIKIEDYASIVIKKKFKERIEEAAVKCAKDILRLVGLTKLCKIVLTFYFHLATKMA